MKLPLDETDLYVSIADAYHKTVSNSVDQPDWKTEVSSINDDTMKLTGIHPNNSEQRFELEMSTSNPDKFTIISETLVPEPFKVKFREVLVKFLQDSFEGDVDERVPTKIFDRYWVTVFDETTPLRIDVGKWMLFYPKPQFDEMWGKFYDLFQWKKLEGVVAMKCSTGKTNSRASDNSEGVIILYCNNSGDEDKILTIGKNILNYIGDYKPGYIYYKSDEQTRVGTRATGAKRNHLYKLATR